MDERDVRRLLQAMIGLLVFVIGVWVAGSSTGGSDGVVVTDGSSTSPYAQGAIAEGVVDRVIDGDTVDVWQTSEIVRVRLLGIDTPETVDPRKPVQCFGAEASEHLRDLLDGQLVTLEYDETQGEIDKYGRHLAYLFLEDGTNVSLQMIAEGYAYEYTYNDPYKYQATFKIAQAEAQETQIGLWSRDTCGGNR